MPPLVRAEQARRTRSQDVLGRGCSDTLTRSHRLRAWGTRDWGRWLELVEGGRGGRGGAGGRRSGARALVLVLVLVLQSWASPLQVGLTALDDRGAGKERRLAGS